MWVTTASGTIELNQFLHSNRTGVGVLQHPKLVIEHHNLACNAYQPIRAVGSVDQLLEQRVVNDFRAHKVPPERGFLLYPVGAGQIWEDEEGGKCGTHHFRKPAGYFNLLGGKKPAASCFGISSQS